MTNYNFLEKWFCSKAITAETACSTSSNFLMEEITDLTTQIVNLKREKNNLIEGAEQSKQENLAKIDALSEQISELTTTVSELNAQLNESLPSDIQTHSPNFYKLLPATQILLDAYMNKYPEGFVVYNGRYWGAAKTRYNLDVKTWLMEGQNDWQIVSMVKACKGRVSDVLKEFPNISFHAACDIAFMRITHAIGDSIQYTYDTSTWGSDVPEFWQFASETRDITKGDCEDKAIINFVAACIAGIPFELLRLVTGTTYSNEGHCTHFYFASDLVWHHRNSTTNYPATKDPKTLPISGDDSESLNIKTVWFSATQTKTFTTFDPTTATAKEKKDGIFKYLRWLE